MKDSWLRLGLIFTFPALLIAIGGAAVGWYADAKYQANAFWGVDPLDRSSFNHVFALGGNNVLIGISRAQKQRGLIGDRKEFFIVIQPKHAKKKVRTYALSFYPNLHGVPTVIISGGPMTPRTTNAWIDYGMTGRFCVKYNSATSLEYYRINNTWVPTKDVRTIFAAGRLPVLVWRGVYYYFDLDAGDWSAHTTVSPEHAKE